jgi:molybdate-binding protein/DNA-binding PadR family transcriptional regulator
MSPLHALLGLLVRNAQYGYELKKMIDAEFAPYWQIDFAQLYRSLAKMTRAGWVNARVEPGKDGPMRKVYALTPSGRQEFRKWIAEPASDRAEFLVKVRLAAEAGMTVHALIESQKNALEDECAKRAQTHRLAQDRGDAGRLVVAHAALREVEASFAALNLCEAVFPARRGVVAPAKLPRPLVISGSDDPLLARLAQLVRTSAHAVGSISGLVALSQHQADVAGVHLLDTETGEYNVPFVKHLMPEDDTILVNLAFRENGLLLARGNPKNIRGVRDLTRRDVRFINRARGTGTRLLLFSRLHAARIDPHTLRDWDRTAATHDAVAAAITTGAADVGPGLRATAALWNLDFIPLGEERYDLVIPRAEFDSSRLRPILSALHSTAFKKAAATFQGYDLSRVGRVIARVK